MVECRKKNADTEYCGMLPFQCENRMDSGRTAVSVGDEQQTSMANHSSRGKWDETVTACQHLMTVGEHPDSLLLEMLQRSYGCQRLG